MKLKITIIAAVAAILLAQSDDVSALTMEQFASICASSQGECSEHPLLQAYVGGALDLIAMLDEETDYLDEVYCDEPTELFDVPAIIRYMETHQEGYKSKNAMLLVIHYLEENGGC